MNSHRYEYRGRNLKVRIIRACLGLVFFVLMPLLAINSSYIKYLCSKDAYIPVSARILEKKYTGSGNTNIANFSDSALVEYKDVDGELKTEKMKACMGDKVGKKIVIGINAQAGMVVRIHPTMNLFQIIMLGFYAYLIVYVQFGKCPPKENVLDAIVTEKRKVLCDGEWKEYVVCYYVDEVGEKHIFESDKLSRRIKLSKGDIVEVLIEPDDYSNYFVYLGSSTISWRKVSE